MAKTACFKVIRTKWLRLQTQHISYSVITNDLENNTFTRTQFEQSDNNLELESNYSKKNYIEIIVASF